MLNCFVMFRFFLFAGFVLVLHVAGLSQDKPQFSFYGYISHQTIYDTYRSLETRDGELYFYPLRPAFDINGVDKNRKPRFTMVEVQSRFGTRISGQEILGADVTGVLEADFFGTHQSYVRMLRLRLAYINLAWDRHQLLIGNAFHPTFVLENFPKPWSFASGVPFHPLNRSPQIRYTFLPAADFNVSLSFITHGYHKSAGPADAQRNSGLPDTQFRLQYGDGKYSSMGFVAGYKYLMPRDVTLQGISTTKTVGSYNLQAYLKHTFERLTFRSEVIYGENLTSFVMIGGYGIRGVEGEVDLGGDYDYANIRTISLWTDMETRGQTFRAGIFAGYTANLGAAHDYIPLPGFARNDDLYYVYRISPRLTYLVNNLSFGFEYSLISAVYGLQWDNQHRVVEKETPAINNRFLLAARYNF
jgi:hypothetical protein